MPEHDALIADLTEAAERIYEDRDGDLNVADLYSRSRHALAASVERERALAAVIEQAREAMQYDYPLRDSTVRAVIDALATAHTSALDAVRRQAKADGWDEGKAAERAFQHRPRGEWYFTPNPYRAAEVERGKP